MKKIVFVLFSLILAGNIKSQTWKIYPSYGTPTKAVKVGSKIYSVSEGALFSYDIEDQSVETYDKTSELSDYGVTSIAACTSLKLLVVLYKDANIDLLGEQSSYNIPDIKQYTMSDKTLNELRVFEKEATISTNSGLIILDIREQNIKNFYDLGQKIQSCIIRDSYIYVKTPNNIYQGDRRQNLLDKSNWRVVSSSIVDFNAFQQAEEQTNQELLSKVKDITISGPKRNAFYRMNMDSDNRLIVAGGCYNVPELHRDGTIMTYENGKWDAFDETSAQHFLNQSNREYYQDITDVVQVPDEQNHYFASSTCGGLFEFKNGKCDTLYSCDNSPLLSMSPSSSRKKYYVRLSALSMDSNNNLWMCNNECDTIIRILRADHTWTTCYISEISKFPTFDQIHFDTRGWAWVNSRRSTSAGAQAGILVISPKGTEGAKSTERHIFVHDLVNDDGTSYTSNFSLLNCIAEDISGRIWIGTNQGIFYIEDPTTIYNTNFTYTQPKVPRNDGTNYADYLLNQVTVKCITVDGCNRKWIGTSGNGVYLVNEDGTEILQHFTTSDSPLISDDIYTIAIDGRTGEVFFGTVDGLCSYMSDYSDPVSDFDKDLVKVYPNPVRPEHTGDIQITGLQNDSYVKIISANGRLIHSGTSVGGKYTWDRSRNGGGNASSGIYYILATDKNGEEGVAGKFLIVK